MSLDHFISICNFFIFFYFLFLINYEINRFTNKEDAMWFEKTVMRVISEEFGEESDCYEFVRPTLYFGDFMRYKSTNLW